MPAFNVQLRRGITLSSTQSRYREKSPKVCLPSTQVILHSHVIPAKFTVNVRGYTANDEDMVCLDLKVDFMRFPFLNVW